MPDACRFNGHQRTLVQFAVHLPTLCFRNSSQVLRALYPQVQLLTGGDRTQAYQGSLIMSTKPTSMIAITATQKDKLSRTIPKIKPAGLRQSTKKISRK
jgi:hypothetical protein